MHGLAQIHEMNGPARKRLTHERVNNIREANIIAREEGIVSKPPLHIVPPMERVEREFVEGSEGIRARNAAPVDGKPAWHGEYQTRGDMGLWHKVRNSSQNPITYSTPEFALAAARLYRDEERVRYEAAFGQDHS